MASDNGVQLEREIHSIVCVYDVSRSSANIKFDVLIFGGNGKCWLENGERTE